MTKHLRTTNVSAILAFAAALVAADATAQSATAAVRAIPTYEAAGLYWSAPGANGNGCDVRYRVSGSSTWSSGLALWFDGSTNECRGSLVSLTPGTAYEAQLGVNGSFTQTVSFTTWSNTVPIAQTIKVPSGSSTLNITAGGTASGYILYDGTGSTLDAQNLAATNINVNASYVIVRGFTLKGAQQHGVLIDKSQHDVIVEDNDISGWGRTRDGTWGTDMDSGIRAICVNQELTRVTIQRNRIHDPRYGANSWDVGHPAGPQGITFSYCGGNNVYRWNEVYSTNGNHYNDPIGGEDNFSTSGFPNADSDIYGNIFANAWDDGIEADGGNRNVRIWGNYIDYTGGSAISTTLNSVGPVYIFRNVWNHNQFLKNIASPDQDSRGVFSKSGSSSGFGNGRRYIFHNTMLQATQAGAQYGLGGGAGIGGTGSAQLTMNTVSMNNIWQVWKPTNGAFYQIGSDGTFQNDMTNAVSTPEVGGIVATPTYAAGNGAQSGSGGLYQLAAGTPGYDQGLRINNFNDGYLGAAPDVGAAEAGAPAMKFGIAAASSTTSGAPTAPTAPTTPTVPTPPAAPVTPSSGMDSSSYTIAAGQSVTFTANVYGNNGTPTGTVNFTSDGVTIAGCGSAAMGAGKATCTTSALAAGSHAIRGIYSGDSTYSSGTAGPITQTVSGAAAATAVDLAVSQSAAPAAPSAGKDLAFTLTVANNGTAAATAVVLTDTLPSGSAFVWATPGCAPSGATVMCNASSLAAGASVQFKVVVRPSAAGSIANNASVAAAQADARTADNASSLAVAVAATPAGQPVARYRLYSPATQEHHFTTSLNEYNVLGASGSWSQEGSTGKVLDNPGSFNGVAAVPYYRLYNVATHWHHWTADANEYYTLASAPGWSAEGVDGYILPAAAAGTVRLLRLFLPANGGLHHWTTDANEYNVLIASYGWIGEPSPGFLIQ